MRRVLIGVAIAALAAACSKPAEAPKAAPAPAASGAPAAASPSSAAAPGAAALSGPAVSGVYTMNGKPAALTQVTARADEPFDGKPVMLLVFTTKDQAGDPKPDFKAVFGEYGDAIVARVQPDGRVIGVDIVHAGRTKPGSVSMSGMFEMTGYKVAGGQVSGHLTSGGDQEVFGDHVTVDLTFHTAAP